MRQFLDETKEQAKKDGFVRTWMGRRRYLPDLSSRNRVLRQAAERMATNTVIQGTAADLIKKAMVDVDRALAAAGLSATMIMQVHDELVFETTEHERERSRGSSPSRWSRSPSSPCPRSTSGSGRTGATRTDPASPAGARPLLRLRALGERRSPLLRLRALGDSL